MASTALPVSRRLEARWKEPAGVRAWLSTVDHKRIGIRYLVTSLVFFLAAGVEAAIMRAQTQGRWLNDATTAPVLRDIVKHCMFVAQTQRKRLFESVLDRLRDKHGADALRRAYKSLAMLLGEIPTRHADARQVPKFL